MNYISIALAVFLVAASGCYTLNWNSNLPTHFTPSLVQQTQGDAILLPQGVSLHDLREITELITKDRIIKSGFQDEFSITKLDNQRFRYVIDHYAEGIIMGSEVYIVRRNGKNKSWEIESHQALID